VFDLFERWKKAVGSPNSNGGSIRLAGAASDFGCTPHRRKQNQQYSRQSCSSNKSRTQNNSLFTNQRQQIVSIEKIETSGVFEVYDITVAEDSSYLSCGVFSHNSGNPNLQNIPTHDKEIGPLCRGMFIPEEGMDFFSGDYSQIEFRLLVHAAYTLSQVKGKRPWDDEVHARLQTADKARQMYIKDPSTDFHNMVVALTGMERAYAKGINFGIAFCVDPETKILTTNLEWKKAQDVVLGEELIGFDEHSCGRKRRRYKKSIVE